MSLPFSVTVQPHLILKKNPPHYTTWSPQYQKLQANYTVTSTKIANQLDQRPKTTNQETLNKNLNLNSEV